MAKLEAVEHKQNEHKPAEHKQRPPREDRKRRESSSLKKPGDGNHILHIVFILQPKG